MKVVILVKKTVDDSLQAKRLLTLVKDNLENIPDLNITCNASMDSDDLNGVPD